MTAAPTPPSGPARQTASGETLGRVRHSLGDREVSPDTAIVNLGLVPFLSGEEPVARFVEVDHDGPLPALLPDGAEVSRRFDSRNESMLLATGPGWTAVLERRPWSESTMVTLSAVTPEVADATVAHLERIAPPRTSTEEGKVPMRIWHYDGGSFSSAKRMIGADEWATTSVNYPTAVRSAVGQLMALQAAPAGGRLILWHGEPGTGKTTAIRSLARAWSSWAETEYVIDPERLFEHSDYLFTVLTHEDDETDKKDRKTRLIVVEDADQFLTSDARREAGSALGRLLNLTDGIVGHGLEALVLITTNEPLSRLHPAVTRPGRCLSNIEFGRFPRAEAVDWLGTDATARVPSDGATLAKLYELRGDTATISHAEHAPVGGTYL